MIVHWIRPQFRNGAFNWRLKAAIILTWKLKIAWSRTKSGSHGTFRKEEKKKQQKKMCCFFFGQLRANRIRNFWASKRMFGAHLVNWHHGIRITPGATNSKQSSAQQSHRMWSCWFGFVRIGLVCNTFFWFASIFPFLSSAWCSHYSKISCWFPTCADSLNAVAIMIYHTANSMAGLSCVPIQLKPDVRKTTKSKMMICAVRCFKFHTTNDRRKCIVKTIP